MVDSIVNRIISVTSWVVVPGYCAPMDVWLFGLGPVAAGVGVLALPGAGAWLRIARWTAIALAVVITVLHLLPESIEVISGWALLPFAVGLVGPVVFERITGVGHEHEHGAPHHIHHDHVDEGGHGSLLLGFLGLGLHQLFDGIQMGLMHPTMGARGTLAIAMHGAPLVAAFALSCRKAAGLRYAISRGVALVALTALGLVLAGAAPTAWIEPLSPWLAAFVGGVLLHVVVHDA